MKQKRDTMGWEHFPHQADIGVRGFGTSRETAFEQAALAMTAVISDLGGLNETESISIECVGNDNELLLLDWLNELLYEMAVRKVLFCRFNVVFRENKLIGTAWGERVDPIRHRPTVEVKGATFTCLSVEQQADGIWIAQCVVDV